MRMDRSRLFLLSIASIFFLNFNPAAGRAAPDPELSHCTFPDLLPPYKQQLTFDVIVEDANGPIQGMAVTMSIVLESGVLVPNQMMQTTAWSNVEGRALLMFDGIQGDATIHLVSSADGIELCRSPSYRVFTGPKIGLHVAPKAGTTCAPMEVDRCSAYNTAGSLRTGYNVYLVVAQADPGSIGVSGLSCGVRYGTGLGKVTWSTCGSPMFEIFGAGQNGEWPASEGGLALIWEPCRQGDVDPAEGMHTLVGGFYIYAYTDDVLEITPNLTDLRFSETLQYYDCTMEQIDFTIANPAVATARFSEGGVTSGYNPCPGKGILPPPPPPPPPPPSWAERTALVLHIGAITDTTVACVSGPSEAHDVVTQAPASVDGSVHYFVYLLGAPSDSSDAQPPGLNGMQLGIEYNQDTSERRGLKVESWHACSDLDFPGDDWPAPRSGNTITWSLGNCQQSPLVVAGYFYVTAYGASVMSLAPFPPTGAVKAADCGGAEFVLNKVLSASAVGWISLGGGRIGPDQDGCNPALESCERATPATPTTWGRLKQQYQH